MNSDIAIVVVAYNRVDSLSRLLRNLSLCNYNDEEVTLIISIDKSESNEVESYADNFIWKYGKKIVEKKEKNLGLRNHMMSLGTFFKDYEALVILEDDLTVAHSFYQYVCQTVSKYKNNVNIAGISLYSFAVNYQTKHLFSPCKDEHDVYFMKCAMSWGEVWIKQQWLSFFEWYNNNQEFIYSDTIPTILFEWKKSWLKYHTRYCIEQNKYFVYPYTSYSTNNSDVGVHSIKRSSLFQVKLQIGEVKKMYLPNSPSEGICYDGFFENEKIFSLKENLCVDLNGSKDNREGCRYWLTTKRSNYAVVKSYGMLLRPIEMNVLNEVEGNDIFMYDTATPMRQNQKSRNTKVKYDYYLVDGISLLRSYGIKNLIIELSYLIWRKFRRV